MLCCAVQQENSFTVELHVDPKYHRFLIGRGGQRARDLRERLAVRLLFPDSPSAAAAPGTDGAPAAPAPDDTVQLVGRRENVLKAKEELEHLIKNLVRTCSLYLDMCEHVQVLYSIQYTLCSASSTVIPIL